MIKPWPQVWKRGKKLSGSKASCARSKSILRGCQKARQIVNNRNYRSFENDRYDGNYHCAFSGDNARLGPRDPDEVTLKIWRRDPSQPSHKATARQADYAPNDRGMEICSLEHILKTS